MKNKKKQKKVIIIGIIVLISVLYIFTYQKYIKYTPDYQRISLVLDRPQKEISFEVDINNWNYFSGYEAYEAGGHDGGVSLFHKSFLTTDESYETYPIFFSYTYGPGFADCGDTGADCEPYISGEGIPESAYFVDINENTRVYVPTLNEDGTKPGYFVGDVLQITQDEFGGNRHRMNFLNPEVGVSSMTDYFEIEIGEFEDGKQWKKEIEPALIHALETFEIKDLSKEKTS